MGVLAGCGPAREAARTRPAPTPTTSPASLPDISSRLVPWSLPEPLSRAVTLPGARADQLLILGGLTASDQSTAQILTLAVATGQHQQVGWLTGPLHDAAGAALGGRDLVLGGGEYVSVAGVQAVRSSLGRATLIGSLPQPRSDAAAVVIHHTAYVIGGYDGTSLDTAVLATTDGTGFARVATLAVPVRYPAVAAQDGRIYVFGGQTSSGAPTAVIQMINPATHVGERVGRLPEAVTGATALVVAGVLFVLGGSTTVAGGTPPNPSIWAFDPATGSVRLAGRLQLPVAHASAVALAGRGWIVGGEGATGPVARVQELFPTPAARGSAPAS